MSGFARRQRLLRDSSYDDLLVAPRYLAGSAGAPLNACRRNATLLRPPVSVPERPAVPTPLEVARRQQRRAPALRAVSVPRWSTSTATRHLPPPAPPVAAPSASTAPGPGR